MPYNSQLHLGNKTRKDMEGFFWSCTTNFFLLLIIKYLHPHPYHLNYSYHLLQNFQPFIITLTPLSHHPPVDELILSLCSLVPFIEHMVCLFVLGLSLLLKKSVKRQFAFRIELKIKTRE